MKPINKLWLSLLLLLPFMGSCIDEDIIKQSNHDIKEGIPVNVALDFNVGASKVVTREASSARAEQTVNTLYVFIFNSDGTLDNAQSFDENNTSGSGSVSLTAHSGYDKRIYAIANHESGSGTLSTENLQAVQTESQLFALNSSLQESTNIERVYFLMSGKLKPAEGHSQVDIDEEGTILDSERSIKLERVDARITFRVKGETKNPDFSDFVFTADRYWVEQIPQGTYVFPATDENNQPKDFAGGYASMSDVHEAVVFEGVESSGENAGYNVFEFYIPENRLTPKARIESNDGEAENLYAMREKREKIQIPVDELDPNKPGETEENGEFKYANANSTYVVFRGVLSYTDNSGSTPKYVNANVTFTVHLGNTGTVADANNVEKVNNYNTERNTHYTYTVTVTGINSMEVEVKNDKEVRPGMEGDVIVAGAEVKSMDSHYGRTHFTLTRGAIKQGLSWAINTPFQQGMKVFVSEYHEDNDGNITENLPPDKLEKLQTDLNLNDYKWVQFVVNKEALKDGGRDGNTYVGSDEFAKYPGYQAYDGGSGTNEPAPAFGSETGYHYSGRTGYYADDVKLYDVNQLINHLYVEANDPNSTIFDDAGTGNDNDDKVAITAFVDEYVYIYDPTEVYYVEPVPVSGNEDNINLKLWKKVVNGSNRMLHLCTSKEIYSPDGNTSLAESVITISQKPIYTFYDPTNEEVDTAWGTESEMETDRLQVDHSRLSNTHDNTHSNGRENTLNIVPRYGSLQWTDVLNVTVANWGDLKSPYNTIWYACLGRNRDLDGDDIVDADEIRWYIASIDQLTDLWIGQNSLNESAHLYQGQEANGTNRLHVASSSYYDSNNDYVWVIWAEEGASRGSSNASAGHEGYAGNKYGDNFEYRCVRNLGLSLNNTAGTAQDYVVTSTNTYDNGRNRYSEYVIDVSRLESNSLRSSSVTGANVELPAHNEREGMNRPYKKFAVLRGYSNYGGSNNLLFPDANQSWEYYQDNKVCPSGYRTPNQRELMLMYTSLTTENESGHAMDWSGSYMTYTAFSYNGKGLYSNQNRPGFLYAGGNLLLVTDGKTDEYGRVRCVRDVTD